jgi:hypothetical protein
MQPGCTHRGSLTRFAFCSLAYYKLGGSQERIWPAIKSMTDVCSVIMFQNSKSNCSDCNMTGRRTRSTIGPMAHDLRGPMDRMISCPFMSENSSRCGRMFERDCSDDGCARGRYSLLSSSWFLAQLRSFGLSALHFPRFPRITSALPRSVATVSISQTLG